MVGSIKVNDVRHGALGRMILIVLLAIILGAALAQSDTPEQRAIAEASRMIGVPRAESGPRGASAYAGDENPFVGRHLSIRLDGPRKVAQAEWQKNPKDLGMVEQAAPWGGTLAQQWSPYWYWKEGDPPQMMGPPIGAYLVWEWTYPAHIARVEVRFPVVEREVSFERALAIMRPIAEAIHLGAMAQRLAASAPPQAQRNTPGAVRRAGQASSSWAHFTSKPALLQTSLCVRARRPPRLPLRPLSSTSRDVLAACSSALAAAGNGRWIDEIEGRIRAKIAGPRATAKNLIAASLGRRTIS